MKPVLSLGIILLSFLSCIKEESKIQSIPFRNIVGNFDGQSMICTSTPINTDTMCNKGVKNDLNVIIESLTTIKVTDATSQFVNQPLTFIKTEQISGDKFHVFSGQRDMTKLKLDFNEKDGKIKFESLVNTDGVVKTDYFVGTKK